MTAWTAAPRTIMSDTTKWIAAVLVIIAGLMYAVNSYTDDSTTSAYTNQRDADIERYIKGTSK